MKNAAQHRCVGALVAALVAALLERVPRPRAHPGIRIALGDAPRDRHGIRAAREPDHRVCARLPARVAASASSTLRASARAAPRSTGPTTTVVVNAATAIHCRPSGATTRAAHRESRRDDARNPHARESASAGAERQEAVGGIDEQLGVVAATHAGADHAIVARKLAIVAQAPGDPPRRRDGTRIPRTTTRREDVEQPVERRDVCQLVQQHDARCDSRPTGARSTESRRRGRISPTSSARLLHRRRQSRTCRAMPRRFASRRRARVSQPASRTTDARVRVARIRSDRRRSWLRATTPHRRYTRTANVERALHRWPDHSTAPTSPERGRARRAASRARTARPTRPNAAAAVARRKRAAAPTTRRAPDERLALPRLRAAGRTPRPPRCRRGTDDEQRRRIHRGHGLRAIGGGDERHRLRREHAYFPSGAQTPNHARDLGRALRPTSGRSESSSSAAIAAARDPLKNVPTMCRTADFCATLRGVTG